MLCFRCVLLRGGPIVGSDRRRVRADCHGQARRLPRPRHSADQLVVNRSMAAEGEGRATLVWRGRLRAADEVDKGPEMNARDLDGIVALLAEWLRNSPAAIRRDVQDDDAEAKVLYLGDDLCEVLVGAGDERVLDCAALRERHQVA